MWSTLTGLVGALIPMLVSCASGSGRSECPAIRQAPASSPVSAPAASTAPAPLGAAPAAPGAAAAAPVASSPESPAKSTPDAASPASSAPALPELKLHLSGMHIGGGPNDEVTKRPFIQAIESAFEPMRACYKKSDDPSHGGTFGVDLKIPHHGGKAEIQQVRTAMKGEGLRECLENTFRGITFGQPPKGPTMVSVSIRFSLQ